MCSSRHGPGGGPDLQRVPSPHLSELQLWSQTGGWPRVSGVTSAPQRLLHLLCSTWISVQSVKGLPSESSFIHGSSMVDKQEQADCVLERRVVFKRGRFAAFAPPGWDHPVSDVCGVLPVPSGHKRPHILNKNTPPTSPPPSQWYRLVLQTMFY